MTTTPHMKNAGGGGAQPLYSLNTQSAHTSTCAFTLIELLVVIAIIGILAAVVLASLGAARQRSEEMAIRRLALEFRTLLEMEYSDTGSYANLKRGWIGNQGTNNETTCEARGYAGAYAARAVEICNGILAARGNPATYTQMLYTLTTSSFNNDQFSIMVRYKTGKMFCVGSSGSISDQLLYNTPNLSAPGCGYNP